MKKIFPLALSVLFGNLFSQSSPQIYTVPGAYSFTVPSGVTTLTIEVVGGGGSGGTNGGGGGGGGGYAKGVYTVTPGSVLSVQVGAGGANGPAGTTSAGNLISATGGTDGSSVANPSIGGGGAGGVGSGGTIANYTGGTGGGGYWTYFGGGGGGAAGAVSNGGNGGNTIAWTGVCQTPGGAAGTGGGLPGGNGGKGAGFTDANCSVSDPSAGGQNYGGGGGGGNGNGGGPGAGAGGYCEIMFGCTVPGAPVNATAVSDQTICENNLTTLLVTDPGTVNWYSTSASAISLGTGTAFITPTLSAGTYSYYAASTNTCSEGPRTEITVTVNALPVMTVNSGTVCSGGSFTFVPGGASTYTYPGGPNVATPTLSSILPSVTAVYTITGTSAEGCSGTVNSSLTVYSLPSLTVSNSALVLCAGQTTVLTASGANTYSWSTGVTTATISITPTITTTYTLTGYNTISGCSNMATVTQSVLTCTGIESSYSNESSLNIYPNPGNGNFTMAAEREINLSILNNLGQIVRTVSLNASNHYKLYISNLPEGVYSMVCLDNKQVIRQKIVITK